MAMESCILKPGQQIKPILSIDEAKLLVEQRYGFSVKKIHELDAYDDLNFRVLCDESAHCENSQVAEVEKDGYVMKIVNSLDSEKTGFIEAQNELLMFLDKKGFVCPVPVKQKDGSYYSMEIIGENGSKHILRLLVFRPGQVLESVPISPELLKSVGLFSANLDKVLEGFSHPAYESQTSLWVLPAFPKLRDFLYVLDNKKDRELIEQMISEFEQKVLSIINSLEKGIIHGDLNENNIIVSSDSKSVAAIIDFGDSYRTCFIFELAVCLCYMIVQSKNIGMAKYVIEGYQMIRRLTDQEKNILKVCVCARIAQSFVLGTYSHQREPNNQYLIRAHEAKWILLKELWLMNDQEVMNLWGINQ